MRLINRREQDLPMTIGCLPLRRLHSHVLAPTTTVATAMTPTNKISEAHSLPTNVMPPSSTHCQEEAYRQQLLLRPCRRRKNTIYANHPMLMKATHLVSCIDKKILPAARPVPATTLIQKNSIWRSKKPTPRKMNENLAPSQKPRRVVC